MKLNKKGIESAPLYLLLSSITLLLTALIMFPAYAGWQDSMDTGRSKAETKKILSAIESVHSLGDIGSTQHVFIELPDGYSLLFKNKSITLQSGNKTLKEYPLNTDLRYRGNTPITGPGKYTLSVVYWTRDDSTNQGKEFILEVFTE